MRLIAWLRRQKTWRREHLESWRGQTASGPDGIAPFQVLCEAGVAETLRRFGLMLSDRRVEPARGADGLEACCIHASVGQAGWRLAIYNDAVLVTRGPEELGETIVWLEEWDARTPADLVQQVCARLEADIQTGVLHSTRTTRRSAMRLAASMLGFVLLAVTGLMFYALGLNGRLRSLPDDGIAGWLGIVIIAGLGVVGPTLGLWLLVPSFRSRHSWLGSVAGSAMTMVWGAAVVLGWYTGRMSWWQAALAAVVWTVWATAIRTAKPEVRRS